MKVNRKRSKRKSRRSRSRSLHLKFRITVLTRMPKSVVFRKLTEFMRTGVMPDDIEISTVDYDHTRGRRYFPGSTIDPDDREELKEFLEVFLSANSVRVEGV